MIYEKKNYVKIKISARFSQFLISSWVEKGHKLSRAEIFQLKLWLKPARLGLITTTQHYVYPQNTIFFLILYPYGGPVGAYVEIWITLY